MSKLLERRAEGPVLTSTQYLIDSLWFETPKELSKPSHLIPILAGGVVYHGSRLASLPMALRWMPAASVFARPSAFTIGVGAEAFTYESLNRFMENSKPSNPFGQAWAFSSFQFGLLRSVAVAMPCQNLILRHFIQDTSMLLGQDLAASWGYHPKTSENFIQRLVQMEVSNLQMMWGLQSFHKIFPQWSLRERAWDLVAQAKLEPLKSPPTKTSASLAWMASQHSTPEAAPQTVIEHLNKLLPADAAAEFRDLKSLERKFASVLGNGKVSPKILNGLRQDFEQLRNPSKGNSLEWEAAVQRLSFLSLHLYLSEKYAAEALFFQRLQVYEGAIQGDYRGETYWYHRSAELAPPPPSDYQGRSRVWMNQLELQLRRRGESLEVNGEVSAQKHPVDPDLVNRIWIVQLLDFAAQVKARVILHDAQILLEPWSGGGKRSEGNLLNRALAEMEKENLSPEAYQVFELIIPHSEVIFGHNRSRATQVNLGWALSRIEMVLNHQVRMAFYEQDSQLVLRVMSPSLFEKLLQAHFGKSATNFYYVPGEISQKAAIQLREQGVAPIGMVRNSLILNDIVAYIPAWLFVFHDIFHATVLSTYPDTLRRFSGRVFSAAQSEALWTNPQGQEHFRRLIDFDSDPQNLHSHAVAYLSESSGRELVKTRNVSPVLGERLRFVEAYENFLRTKIEASPERENLLRELGKVSKSLRRSHAQNRWLRLLGYQIHYPSNSER